MLLFHRRGERHSWAVPAADSNYPAQAATVACCCNRSSKDLAGSNSSSSTTESQNRKVRPTAVRRSNHPSLSQNIWHHIPSQNNTDKLYQAPNRLTTEEQQINCPCNMVYPISSFLFHLVNVLQSGRTDRRCDNAPHASRSLCGLEFPCKPRSGGLYSFESVAQDTGLYRCNRQYTYPDIRCDLAGDSPQQQQQQQAMDPRSSGESSNEAPAFQQQQQQQQASAAIRNPAAAKTQQHLSTRQPPQHYTGAVALGKVKCGTYWQQL